VAAAGVEDEVLAIFLHQSGMNARNPEVRDHDIAFLRPAHCERGFVHDNPALLAAYFNGEADLVAMHGGGGCHFQLLDHSTVAVVSFE